MITNATVKLVTSLADAKGRRRSGMFVAEGSKCVIDTIGRFELQHLYATQAWLDSHPLDPLSASVAEAVGRADLGRMTTLMLAPDVIAVYRLPEPAVFDPTALHGQLVVALDRVQDPGNLGTIMRTADWMGIDTILASSDTVDCFNPKAIQATMGAVSRVRVIYGDLPAMLGKIDMPVYGTFLDGDNIYTSQLTPAGVVVMGNEGRGVSPEVAACVSRRLLIPSYPPGRPTSESLNVATATAMVLAQFRSKLF
ncbi:MAG: RNA methyltransferase [Bacteroidales bacterium]|nr:RNA methyltransferase [Bacteroidales bacterium]